MEQQEIDAVVGIDQSDLSGEMSKLPGLLAYYSTLCAEAEAEETMAEHRLKEEYARLYNQKRLAGKLQADKKKSEAQVDCEIESDSNYLGFKRELVSASKKARIMKGVVDALRAKREMLTSMALLKREELRVLGC